MLNMTHNDKGTIIINLDDIIAVTTQLMHLMAQETMHLKMFRIKEIAALQEEKLKHVLYLEATKQLMASDPALLLSLPHDKVRELKTISTMMAEIMEENHYEIVKARQANKKVLEIMTSLVVQQVQGRSGYNRHGTMGNYVGKNGTLPALSVNNRI